jgi:hypothetical protein
MVEPAGAAARKSRAAAPRGPGGMARALARLARPAPYFFLLDFLPFLLLLLPFFLWLTVGFGLKRL